MGVRAQQKEKTRRALVDAAFNQLSAERSFSSLSLREVAREANIAPTSFYRHFKDMNELGLTMVDEGGLALRQMMRKGRQRAEAGGSVIRISVETFMEVLESNPNVFRILLHERSGTSAAFRAAVEREIEHFISELSHYVEDSAGRSPDLAREQAEALVILVFNAGAAALDMKRSDRKLLADRLVTQLRMVVKGAEALQQKRDNPELRARLSR
ncbi:MULTISPECIES: HTH-type transcriptional repressor FabR [Shewanella]|jgi:AcrR family transcriptional regulator|uniref:TetR family transcriptional regulator n=1 Tax=Shewanella fodinae TaxID=552357 RepID=A0A4R2F8K7_9GAMM|nr:MULTISPECIES: HTH-type transcriptional repressor FabR [Shewanella]MDN5368921.1 TetR/AcrR family transcriptional regulator, fatty acid biosynthesis regulator [Shewanella sp.]MBO1272747.1 HTH-type transcriptional repressor FabR [Shewanella sp. 4t3-1-2LB]MCL2906773.1 HTH-type transcriptional repressor FabR [Shewanella fodinae]TCN79340.1 TetR family transcriptional regulator [Shewanella fodinae]GGZ02514.1 DNA-binding transcriptional regulator FabR [Shewanella fodinae]